MLMEMPTQPVVWYVLSVWWWKKSKINFHMSLLPTCHMVGYETPPETAKNRNVKRRWFLWFFRFVIINYGMLDVIWGRDVSWGIETIRWDRQKVHVEDKENWFGKGSTTLASWNNGSDFIRFVSSNDKAWSRSEISWGDTICSWLSGNVYSWSSTFCWIQWNFETENFEIVL